jgi:hypothetical protein
VADDLQFGDEKSMLRFKVKELEAEFVIMRGALESWMESYRLMADKTDGTLRDSIRGFFLDCPWDTSKALKSTAGADLLAELAALRRVVDAGRGHTCQECDCGGQCDFTNALAELDLIK